MTILKKWGIPLLWGLAYAALVILSSQLLVRSLGALAGLFAADSPDIVQAVGQLKNASLSSPWLVALPAGAVAGVLLRAIFHKPKVRHWVSGIAGGVLFLPLVVVALAFTHVNTILVITLLQNVLPIFLG